MSENDAKYCMRNGVPLEVVYKNYKGCSNCKHQPAPSMTCDYWCLCGIDHIFCKGWEENDKKTN